MTFSLGNRSLTNLEGVRPEIVRVVKRAILITEQDFFVNEGVRTLARQKELYAQGRTKPGKKVTWTLNSRHFVQADRYGHAVDLYPFPYNPEDKLGKFDAIAKAMFAAAAKEGVHIRWGADWDQDGKPRERGETDSPHFEWAGHVVPGDDT